MDIAPIIVALVPATQGCRQAIINYMLSNLQLECKGCRLKYVFFTTPSFGLILSIFVTLVVTHIRPCGQL